LNNDFASLLVGIENGRLVFENIKKVLMYLMPAGSYAEFMPVLLNVFFGMQLAMSSFLQVVFCVANDVVMSISLMYEKAESDLMKRPPRNPRVDRLTDWKFFLQIYCFFGVGIWLSGFGMWFLYMNQQGLGFYDLVLVFDEWGDGWAGKSIDELTNYVNVGNCIYYVCLAIMQFGSILAVRNRHVSILESNPLWGPRQNLVIPFSMVSTIIICIICLYGPGLQNVFDTAPIPVMFWFIPFGLAVGNLLLDESRKLIVRRYPKSIIAKIAW
jgi:sodium/potassium-transporting ATPase subunit alpha